MVDLSDTKIKHLAQAGYLGPNAQEEARRTHTVYPVKHMIVIGELTTGFQFYGPFDTVATAGQWATANLRPGTPHRVHDLQNVKDGR